MEPNHQKVPKFPLGLKIAACYLILVGFIGLIWPLLGLGPHHADFAVESTAYQAGAYARKVAFDILFMVSGMGLLFRKRWARITALVVLALNTVYASNAFAWGFAGGSPTTAAYGISLVIVGAWNAIWFYLIFRKGSARALS